MAAPSWATSTRSCITADSLRIPRRSTSPRGSTVSTSSRTQSPSSRKPRAAPVRQDGNGSLKSRRRESTKPSRRMWGIRTSSTASGLSSDALLPAQPPAAERREQRLRGRFHISLEDRLDDGQNLERPAEVSDQLRFRDAVRSPRARLFVGEAFQEEPAVRAEHPVYRANVDRPLVLRQDVEHPAVHNHIDQI